MTEECCTVPTAQSGSPCPTNGALGAKVAWTTVAALTHVAVPPKQEFRLCRDPECDIVYYGAAGDVLRTHDLTVRPGFKDGAEGLLCYCFLHLRSEIARQLEATADTDVFRSIKVQVRAGNCACEVRNPSGKCCLGDVQQAIGELREQLGAPA